MIATLKILMVAALVAGHAGRVAGCRMESTVTVEQIK